MADFEAPSFSLGFEGSDTETQPPDLQVSDSDPEPEPQPSRVFKRLRRGLSNEFTPSQQNELPETRLNKDGNVDDDIEEFSSQENPISADPSSAQRNTMCSSSKFPQHGSLSFHLASQSKFRTKQVPQAPGCSSKETCTDKVIFPKLTISPLRRFQLIDSDSDDLPEDGKTNFPKLTISPLRRFQLIDSDSDDLPEDGKTIFPKLTISPLRRFQLIDSDSDDLPEDGKTSTFSKKFDALSKEKEKQSTPAHIPSVNVQRRGQASTSTSQTEDLWKDFSPIKRLHVPTPAFDEVCEEYFQRVHDKNVNKAVLNDESTSKTHAFTENKDSDQYVAQQWDSTDSCPPAYHYFYHDNPKIQTLVRKCLSNFCLLGGAGNMGNECNGTSAIDYRNQFCHGEASRKQVNRNSTVERSWGNGRKNSRKSKPEEVHHASDGWVNPKSGSSGPKDAGKRRVHAEVHSSGHWFTGPDGRRVYVNKQGQELTGQIAYRNYRKESGGGFRKTAKKTRAKKK